MQASRCVLNRPLQSIPVLHTMQGACARPGLPSQSAPPPPARPRQAPLRPAAATQHRTLPQGLGLLLSWRSAQSACSWSPNSTNPMPLERGAPPRASSSTRILACRTTGCALLARSLTCAQRGEAGARRGVERTSRRHHTDGAGRGKRGEKTRLLGSACAPGPALPGAGVRPSRRLQQPPTNQQQRRAAALPRAALRALPPRQRAA